MNRAEAYEILIAKLRELRDAHRVIELGQVIEEHIKGEAGTTYTLTFRVKDGKLWGQIHDGNNFKFVLLEEELGLPARDDRNAI